MRYWVLLGMLLVPVGAWAEVKHTSRDMQMDCIVWLDNRMGIQMQGPGCPPQTHQDVCLAKMREAMRLMSEKLKREETQFSKDGSVRMHFNIEKNEQAWKVWDQTMKECVND